MVRLHRGIEQGHRVWFLWDSPGQGVGTSSASSDSPEHSALSPCRQAPSRRTAWT